MTSFSRAIIVGLGFLCFVGGCGYNPEDPVYDTKSNPENFPPAAINIIEGVQQGRLNDFETVADAFGTLYDQHLELLDNTAWHEVVTKLGVKFKLTADSLADIGLAEYARAAGLYKLAAFARPDDSEAKQKHSLFETWTDELENSSLARAFAREVDNRTLDERIELLKLFYLSDSTARDFARRYLVDEVVEPREDWLNHQALQTLSRADQAFLVYAGLIDASISGEVARFSDPEIILVDCQIKRVEDSLYRVECYFKPEQQVKADYAVAFRIATQDSSDFTVTYENEQFIPYDFAPVNASSSWEVGDIAPAADQFYYAGPPREVAVGLYLPDSEPPRFLRVKGDRTDLLLLDSAIFP